MYIAPLRQAILDLARSGKQFTADAIAIFGKADPRAARLYVRRLANNRILAVDEFGRIQPATEFDAWVAKAPKTRRGGNRRSFLRSGAP